MRLAPSLTCWAVLLPSERPLPPRAPPLVPALDLLVIVPPVLDLLGTRALDRFMGAIAGNAAAIAPTGRGDVASLPNPRRPNIVMQTLIIAWTEVPNFSIVVVATRMNLATPPPPSDGVGVLLRNRWRLCRVLSYRYLTLLKLS